MNKRLRLARTLNVTLDDVWRFSHEMRYVYARCRIYIFDEYVALNKLK